MLNKKIFICGSYHGNNFGDLAILDTFVGNLEKSGEYNFNVLSKDPNGVTKSLGWENKTNVSFVPAKNLFKIISAIRSSDKVIIGGGGLFFDYGFFDTILLVKKSQLLTWVGITLAARLFRKRVYWYAVGVGPFSWFGRILMKIGSKCAYSIKVRDEGSLNLMKNELKITKTQKSADIVFRRKFLEEVKINQESKTQFNKIFFAFKGSETNLDKYSELISKVKSSFPNLEISLFSTNPKTDNSTHEKLSKELSVNFIDTSNFNLAEFYNIFNECDLLVSMRLHGLLIAFQEGIVGVGISSEIEKIGYQNKVTQFQKDFYEEELYLDGFDSEELKRLIDKIMSGKQKFVEEGIGIYEGEYKLSEENLLLL